MNYTENYHLPQWEETDRIMRTDFNQMCADMEEGMCKNAASAAEADKKASDADKKASAEAARVAGEAENRAFDRISRMAYNHYRTAQTISPFPRQLGVFYRDTGASGEGLTGMISFQNWKLASNAVDMDVEGLFALFELKQNFSISSLSNRTHIAIFTAPFCAVIHDLPFHLSSSVSELRADYPCRAKIFDVTENREVMAFEWVLTAGQADHQYTVDLPIRQEHQYRVEVAPTTPKGMDLSGKLSSKKMTFTRMFTGENASASHTFRDPEENLGMVAAASYRPTGDCAQPRLFAGGEEVPAWWTRTAENGKDREIVFRRNKPVKNGETITLRFSCGTGGTLELYDWGVFLI